MALRAGTFVRITDPHHRDDGRPDLAGTVARSGPRGGAVLRSTPAGACEPSNLSGTDSRLIMVYFGIEIFEPSRVTLYMRPCWPTTNPTIG
jgi:hypothetical protein